MLAGILKQVTGDLDPSFKRMRSTDWLFVAVSVVMVTPVRDFPRAYAGRFLSIPPLISSTPHQCLLLITGRAIAHAWKHKPLSSSMNNQLRHWRWRKLLTRQLQATHDHALRIPWYDGNPLLQTGFWRLIFYLFCILLFTFYWVDSGNGKESYWSNWVEFIHRAGSESPKMNCAHRQWNLPFLKPSKLLNIVQKKTLQNRTRWKTMVSDLRSARK